MKTDDSVALTTIPGAVVGSCSMRYVSQCVVVRIPVCCSMKTDDNPRGSTPTDDSVALAVEEAFGREGSSKKGWKEFKGSLVSKVLEVSVAYLRCTNNIKCALHRTLCREMIAVWEGEGGGRWP